jgi:CRP-like cAMP-binding protein
LFHPEHAFRICWDISVGCLLLYSVIIIPYRIGFNVIPSKQEDDIDWWITALFATDILIQFNSMYFDPRRDIYVTNKNQIVWQYLRFWFWIDLLSTIPFDSIMQWSSHSVIVGAEAGALRMIRIFRLVRLFKFFRLAKSGGTLHKLRLNPSLVDLLLLITQIFYISHLFACFWHFLTLDHVASSSTANSWVKEFGYSDSSTYQRYIASMYFIVVTMLTVGYGDIYATNDLERFYVIVTMVAGGVVFGALVAKVAAALDKRDPEGRIYKEKMHELKAFLADIDASVDLRNRAKVCLPKNLFCVQILPVFLPQFAYSFYLRKKSSVVEQNMFENLSPYVRQDLVSSLYEKDISLIKVFKRFDQSFLIQLVMHSRPFHADVGEVVFSEGDLCEDIVLVMTGTVQLSVDDGIKDSVIGYITEGDMFGDAEFFWNTTAYATYTAVQPTRMLLVSHSSVQRSMSEDYNISNKLKVLLRRRHGNLLSVLRSKVSRPKLDVLFDQFLAKNSPEPEKKQDVQVINKILQKTSSVLLANRSKRRNRLQRFQNELHHHHNPSHQDQTKSNHQIVSLKGQLFSTVASVPDLTVPTSAPPVPSQPKPLIYHNGKLTETFSVKNGEIVTPLLAVSSTNSTIRVVYHPNDKKLHDTNHTHHDPPHYHHHNADGYIITDEHSSILSANWMLHPRDIRKTCWDLLIVVAIMYSVLIIPVEVGFQEIAFPASNRINMVVSCLFFLDIAITFRTCYQSKRFDALVISKRMIAWKYLTTWFWIDVISTIPLDDMFSFATNHFGSTKIVKALKITKLLKVVRLLRLLRLTRLVKLNSYLEMIEDFLGISPALFELLSVLVQVFFAVHLSCCAWWGLTTIIASPTEQWYPEHYAGSTVPLARKYLLSSYFAFTTMTTVGYGDLHVQNVASEQILNSILVVLGASVFGYMIANISSVLNAFSESKQSTAERLNEASQYLRSRHCATKLSTEVLTHLERRLHDQSAFDVQTIANCLPPAVRVEVLSVLHEQKMKKIPIFRHLHNESIAVHIFLMMSPIHFETGRYIIKEGDVANDVLFLVNGKARAFQTNAIQYLKKIQLQVQRKNEKQVRLAEKIDELLKTIDPVRHMPSASRDDGDHIIHRDLKSLKSNRFSKSNVLPTKKTFVGSRWADMFQAASDRSNCVLSDDCGDIDHSDCDDQFTSVHNLELKDMNSSSSLFSSNKNMQRIVPESPYNSPAPAELLELAVKKSEKQSKRPSIDEMAQQTEDLAGYKSKRDEAFFTTFVTKSESFKGKSDDAFNQEEQSTFASLTHQDFELAGYLLIGDVSPGDFVGHVAFLTDSTHDASVRSLEPTTVYSFSKTDLARIIRDEQAVGIQLQSAIAHAALAQAEQVGKTHMREERASFLRDMKNKYFERHQHEFLPHGHWFETKKGLVIPIKSPLPSARDMMSPRKPTHPSQIKQLRKEFAQRTMTTFGKYATHGGRNPQHVDSLFSKHHTLYDSSDDDDLTVNRKPPPPLLLRRSVSLSSIQGNPIGAAGSFIKLSKTSIGSIQWTQVHPIQLGPDGKTENDESKTTVDPRAIFRDSHLKKDLNPKPRLPDIPRARRQSFPSLENVLWKEMRIHQGVV